ncbi:MAG: hypothetical protein Q9191_003010 [Dirinaria sp. TL-2023a]
MSVLARPEKGCRRVINELRKEKGEKGETCVTSDDEPKSTSDQEEYVSDKKILRSEQSTSHVEVKTVLSRSHLILLEHFAGRRISFLHRTARDFLIDTDPGRDILQYYSPTVIDWQPLWLRVQLIDMLASLKVFNWDVADCQMSNLLGGGNAEILENNGIRIFGYMPQVNHRLISPNLLNAVSGYSNFIFSYPHACDLPRYHRDFVGFAASYGLTAYLRKFLDQCEEGLKPRRDFIDYLLLCSSRPSFLHLRTNEHMSFLLAQGAAYLLVLHDPNMHNAYGIDDGITSESTSEYIKLQESIFEVDARSEPVDVYQTMIEMGYMKSENYDFSPVEPFEEIGVDTLSDQEKDVIASKQQRSPDEGSGAREVNDNVNKETKIGERG